MSNLTGIVYSRRAAIQSAFYETLYFSLFPDLSGSSRGEVATLIRFFLQLPALQETLNAVMHKSGARISLKGVFCHVSGRTGPVVEFDVPRSGPGCEICDLLVLVTYAAGGTTSLGNAVFLQAKQTRADLTKGGSSTNRQRELYEKAPQFRFRFPERYKTSLDEPRVPGTRQMPPKDYGGFCYWPFATHSGATGLPVNSSTVITPKALPYERDDWPFGAAMLELIIGKFGEQVNRAKKNDFGWNRIVHDVVFRSMQETLRCSAGIKDVKSEPRVFDGRADLLAALNIALISNPFVELENALGSPDLAQAARELSERGRIDERELQLMMRKFADEPPHPPIERTEVGDDEGGGGAFIQIHVAAAD